jgi:hypothetical protein
MNRVAIQRVGLGSALKFGGVLGALLSVLPSLFGALVGKWIVSTLRALLESWQNIELGSILGQSMRVNLTQQLGLEPMLKMLREWDALAWLGVLLVTVALSVFGGALVAAFSGLLAAVYNIVARFSGGIEVELAGDAPSAPLPAGALELRTSAPRARLMGTGLPAGGFVLQQDVVRVGRDPSNQLVLASPTIAPYHAEFFRMGERWIVRDLGSPTGTFVNDRPVRENMLKDGFRVRVGDAEWVFRLG